MEENTQIKKEESEILEHTGKSGKKKWMKYAKIGFLLLVAVFLIRYFYRNYDSYKNLDVEINWLVFTGAILFYFLYKVTLASLWHYMTKLNQCSIGYFRAITAYLYSILGKYIPGKVFMLLARVPAYEEGGAPIRKVTVCFFLENICTLLGAAFLFLISLFFFPNDLLNDYKWMTVGLVVLFFICINPKIINFFLKILERFIDSDHLWADDQSYIAVYLQLVGRWCRILYAGMLHLSGSDIRVSLCGRNLRTVLYHRNSCCICTVRSWRKGRYHAAWTWSCYAKRICCDYFYYIQTVADRCGTHFDCNCFYCK